MRREGAIRIYEKNFFMSSVVLSFLYLYMKQGNAIIKFSVALYNNSSFVHLVYYFFYFRCDFFSGQFISFFTEEIFFHLLLYPNKKYFLRIFSCNFQNLEEIFFVE